MTRNIAALVSDVRNLAAELAFLKKGETEVSAAETEVEKATAAHKDASDFFHLAVEAGSADEAQEASDQLAEARAQVQLARQALEGVKRPYSRFNLPKAVLQCEAELMAAQGRLDTARGYGEKLSRQIPAVERKLQALLRKQVGLRGMKAHRSEIEKLQKELADLKASAKALAA